MLKKMHLFYNVAEILKKYWTKSNLRSKMCVLLIFVILIISAIS